MPWLLGLGALLTVLVLFLWAPIHIRGELRDTELEGQLLFFGWFGVPLHRSGERAPSGRRGFVSWFMHRRTGHKKRSWTVLRDPAFRRNAVRAVKRLAGAFRVRALRGHLVVGLDDPADTGILWGTLGPLAIVAREHYPQVSVRPEFRYPCIHVVAMGSVVFRPIDLIGPILVFLVRPSTLRVLRGSA